MPGFNPKHDRKRKEGIEKRKKERKKERVILKGVWE
jgi:hypothetical protein